MKRIFTILILSGISTALVQCTAKKATTKAPAAGDDAVIAEIKRNFTPAHMEEGKLLWRGNCDKCHKMYDPASYSIAKWEKILPVMSQKAKLTEDQASKVRAYVITASKPS